MTVSWRYNCSEAGPTNILLASGGRRCGHRHGATSQQQAPRERFGGSRVQGLGFKKSGFASSTAREEWSRLLVVSGATSAADSVISDPTRLRLLLVRPASSVLACSDLNSLFRLQSDTRSNPLLSVTRKAYADQSQSAPSEHPRTQPATITHR